MVGSALSWIQIVHKIQRNSLRSVALGGLALAVFFLIASGETALAGKKTAVTVHPQKSSTTTPVKPGQPPNQLFKFPFQRQPANQPAQSGGFRWNQNSKPSNQNTRAFNSGNSLSSFNRNAPGITRSPFHSTNRGFLGLFQGAPGSKGYKSLSSFRARGVPTAFRRDRATGDFELLVGPNLLDLGAPESASVVAVQDLPDGQLTILRASSEDCPVDYVAVDASAAPYHNWHMGDCHTNLAFWTNGNQLFAQSAEPGDGRTWVYSGGRMYGPLAQTAVFRGSMPAPPPPPQDEPATEPQDSSQAGDEAQPPADSGPPPDSTQTASSTTNTKHSSHHSSAQQSDATQANNTAAPPTPQRLPRTARFDPSCLNGAAPIEAQNTPCTYTPGSSPG
jgi:hypothetical protein